MAVVDATGVTPTDLSGYLDRLDDVLRGALGADLDLASETPQGQLAGLLALALTEVDEAVVSVSAGLNLNQAAGRQLDDWGTLLRLRRISGENSTVTATLSGAAGTQVPAGSRARTSGGAIFATEADALIGASGQVDAVMRAVETGPILAAAGELDSLVDVLPGWTGVTNSAAAIPGRDVESDAEFRRRYTGEAAVHAVDSLEAMRARILQQPGVVDALVRDNPTASQVVVQGVTIPANAIAIVVQGGAAVDVAQAIERTRPAGIPLTAGSVSLGAVTWNPVTLIPLAVEITIQIGSGFPSDGLTQLRQRLADWASGLWRSAPGDFDTSGLGIGEALDTMALAAPLLSVPGHRLVSTVVTERAGGPLRVPELAERLTIDTADVTVTVA